MEIAAVIENDERTLLEKLEKLQGSYIGTATDDSGSLEAVDFARLRTEILTRMTIVLFVGELGEDAAGGLCDSWVGAAGCDFEVGAGLVEFVLA
jgi:hypothetical protein